MNIKKQLALLAAAVLFSGQVEAAGVSTNGMPQAGGAQYPSTLPLTGNEQAVFDTLLSGGRAPQTEAINVAQLSAYDNALPLLSNALIGGDATTNLFQRATTGSSVTTTVTYGGPDRWAYWSGTSTAMTVSQDSATTDVPQGFKYAFKMARTSGQTGVVQMCMAQEIESANSYQFQGQVAELDFNAYTGANFSAANPFNMTAYIVYGTGTDEGISKLAFGLNAGGGGSSAWTGQANATAAVISLGAVSTAGRYAAVASIPSTATEIAVALCYTPTGTAGTNDYVAFSGIQLSRNPANSSLASATVGYSCATQQCANFIRRSQADETVLQERYFWQQNEAVSGVTVFATCNSQSTTVSNCVIPNPVTMRIAPTPTCTFGTMKLTVAGTATATTACAAVSNGSTPFNTEISATTGATQTAGDATILESGNSTGGGVISASAEL